MTPERTAAIKELLPSHDLPALFQLRDSISLVNAYMVGQMAAPNLKVLGQLVDDEIQKRKQYAI